MTARFNPGECVTVIDRDVRGHNRTPAYIRGHTGVVERICGVFPNPEALAYGGDGLPAQPLYRVRFSQTAVWPHYRGQPGDTVDIELYEHWLESAKL